jgi:hypothetical protein
MAKVAAVMALTGMGVMLGRLLHLFQKSSKSRCGRPSSGAGERPDLP